jgi:phytoene dehydrogenase-like protein
MDPDKLLPLRWKKRVLNYEMTMPSLCRLWLRGSLRPAAGLPSGSDVRGQREALDEADITLYLPSLEDPSLAPADQSTFLIIGPSLRGWPEPESPAYGNEDYRQAKKEEAQRMLALVERRIPGFVAAIHGSFEASPSTIWRYLGKDGGSVAGRSRKWGSIFCSGNTQKGPARVYSSQESPPSWGPEHRR